MRATAQASRHLMPATWWGRVQLRVNEFSGSSPSRFALIVFTTLILLFTLLLSLPFSAAGSTGTPLADAFFTAVSVICVTGLSTVDMAEHWSAFGHVVVYVGVQIGGVGVLTLASILGMVISRKLGLRAKLIAASDSNPLRAHAGPVAEGQAIRLGEIGSLLRTVALSAVFIELVVALVLFPRMLAHGFSLYDSSLNSLYYSAMAFTNTGFTPNESGLTPFATDYVFLTALMVGVIAGAIGFPVIYAIAQNLRRNVRRRFWTLHVKLTLVTFALLLVAGWVLYFALEVGNPRTLSPGGAGDAAFQSLFMSAMARSGGFSVVDIDHLHTSSLMVTDMLMFVGGGSASTAGGIKVTTLAVLFLAALAEARGVDSMEAFRRRIPTDVLRVAVSVVLWGATIVAVSTVTVLAITRDSLDHVLFDVISAFATCGLSTGLTQHAPTAAVYVLAITMFLGRVGTVTLAAALAQSQRGQYYQHPEERPIVG
ncbi:TrkH family potassium uptake protein [Planctomonas sp. JC2975]|uniref:potassium transporter TrkG n=1 Tax=Planctomonas sp. JC2975 TaxID=2729626 RepID=UPI001474506A|nr:potassium transporter TrkG [Planctomonas sp. JC2975]NNC13464.1 TrkH family potassium uptake protein [Planctomonas sp. JC2975]